jgi:hypothetical protein
MKPKTLLPLILLLIAAGSACTRPAEAPSPDSYATLLAATLTAAPTLPPSRTPPPSATSIITPETASTETVLPDAGPSSTPIELASDDPRFGLNLSVPDYLDDFSSELTWIGPNFDGAVNFWEDSRLKAIDYKADAYIWWSTTLRDVDAGNVYVEVTAEIGECSGRDAYGLALRVSGNPLNSGYTLEFSCDGAYRIRKLISGSVATITDWTAVEAIQTGSNTINRMGFFADGSTLWAFANGERLGTAEDASLFVGTYALFASAEDTPGLTITFDDFSLWYLPTP